METVINKDPVCGMDVEPERAAASTNLLIPPHRFIKTVPCWKSAYTRRRYSQMLKSIVSRKEQGTW